MMNDTAVACFFSVARTGSFTVSARELGSTQQAVSRNIQSLEDELGFLLLDRSGRTAASVTWEGERFLRWCMEFDRQLAAVKAAASRLSGREGDTLRLGWLDWTGCPEDIEEDIRAFSSLYPTCSVQVFQGELRQIRQGLEDRTLDAAILPEHAALGLSGAALSQPFMDLPLYAAVHKRYAFPAAGPSPSDLTDMRLLAVSFVGGIEDARARLQLFFAPLGIRPVHVEIMPNALSVLTELACGPCYTVVPRSPLAVRRGDIRFYPLALSAPLVFARPQTGAPAWEQLFESFVRQRRGKR